MAIFRAVNNGRKCLNKCSENVQVFSFLSENVIDALGSKDHVHFLQVEGHWYRFPASFVPEVEQLS